MKRGVNLSYEPFENLGIMQKLDTPTKLVKKYLNAQNAFVRHVLDETFGWD